MNSINITTSLLLTKKQADFFKEKRIKMSPFIRDLIDASKDYKRWRDEKT